MCVCAIIFIKVMEKTCAAGIWKYLIKKKLSKPTSNKTKED
jgi:hypothetical protein